MQSLTRYITKWRLCSAGTAHILTAFTSARITPTAEVKELKFDCNCRKLKPGMLLQAAKDFNMNLEQSYMIGDGEHDRGAREAAGCKAKIIPTDGDLLKAVEEILEDRYDRES